MSRGHRYKKTPVNKKPIIISIVSIVVALAVAVGVFFFVNAPKKERPPVEQVTVTEEKPTTATEKTKQTEETQMTSESNVNVDVHSIEQPDELTEMINHRDDLDYDIIQSLACEQLVTVKGEGTNAEIRFYEFINGQWTEDATIRCSGFVGQMGTVDKMSEDISGTPKGFYPVGEAFYRSDKPQTSLDIFQITDDTYWVDDPDSKYYNQKVEGTANKDWDSAEHMNDYSTYDYGFVINYNMPAKYNAGSAIFFHVGYKPTAGCVATSEEMVMQYLIKLNKAKSPYILIE